MIVYDCGWVLVEVSDETWDMKYSNFIPKYSEYRIFLKMIDGQMAKHIEGVTSLSDKVAEDHILYLPK